jgi:hypothetical protein
MNNTWITYEMELDSYILVIEKIAPHNTLCPNMRSFIIVGFY